MGIIASFQIISRPVDRLGLELGSEFHIVGRLGSGPRVEAVVTSGGIFGRCGLSPRELSPGGYLLESPKSMPFLIARVTETLSLKRFWGVPKHHKNHTN